MNIQIIITPFNFRTITGHVHLDNPYRVCIQINNLNVGEREWLYDNLNNLDQTNLPIVDVYDNNYHSRGELYGVDQLDNSWILCLRNIE